MTILDYCGSDVKTVRLEATVPEVIDTMTNEAIGSVVVVDREGRPVGIVTDRDLACRVIAQGREAAKTCAGEVMSRPLITASPHDAVEHVIERMRAAGVRRLPVVSEDRLVGLISLDDLLVSLARDLDDLGEAVRREIEDARKLARLETRRDQIEDRLRELRGQIEHVGKETREALGHELEALRERLGRLRR